MSARVMDVTVNKFGMDIFDARKWQESILGEAIGAPLKDPHRSAYQIAAETHAMMTSPGAMVGFEKVIEETYFMLCGMLRFRSAMEV
jgi:hypothetical protein